ncbi:hypothetical protein AGMMS50212_10610 [Spirochaetia bacterium]|nr:hypothetical protein AGMMS50212_10610 [Spirochaetia bacterium]
MTYEEMEEMEESGLGDLHKTAGEIVTAMFGGIDKDKLAAEYLRSKATREAKWKAEKNASYAEERTRYEKLRQKWGANLTNEQLDEAERKEAESKANDYEIGDTGPSGGLVFSDWDAGNDRWGYLECAPPSAEFKTEWSNAESRCRNLNINGFTGWRVPTMNELRLMNTSLAKKGLGNFSDRWYCSSEEDDSIVGKFAWCLGFPDGRSYSRPVHNFLTGNMETQFFRPVRSFSGVMTKRKEAKHNAEVERQEAERRAKAEAKRQATEALYQKGNAAYEEGKKSFFSRKKKYHEAADFFRQAAEQGHAEAREWLDRLKTEGKVK